MSYSGNVRIRLLSHNYKLCDIITLGFFYNVEYNSRKTLLPFNYTNTSIDVVPVFLL